MVKNIGIKRFKSLIKEFGTIENIFKANKKELKKVEGISDKLIYNLLNKEIREKAKKDMDYSNKYKIKIISILDKEYPYNLRQIYDAPICLYILGNIQSLSEKCISIVGCRECSEYGKEISQKISYELATNKINIVSGLAKGIDTYSHIGAIKAKGKTIAVLGSGINEIYPYENIKLAKEIINNKGAIISEQPIGTKPEKKNFPARNRIISGLSESIIVVEAKRKSGTLITVDYALEQGRDVFVVPRKYKFNKFRRNK